MNMLRDLVNAVVEPTIPEISAEISAEKVEGLGLDIAALSTIIEQTQKLESSVRVARAEVELAEETYDKFMTEIGHCPLCGRSE